MSNTNASASAFGWDFQSNAALVLMLKNIKRAVSVKVEGKTEDIEILLDNGDAIFSQAKSVFKPDDYSNVKAKMKAALGTLNESAKLPNIEKLIYITNSPNPFNDVASMSYFYGNSSYAFSALPDSCQEAIKAIIQEQSYNDIDCDKLEVHVIPFVGDDDNRYKIMKEATYEFLHMVGINESGLGKSILETWQRFLSINASHHDLSAAVTKRKLIWPLIVSVCEISRDEAFFSAYDEGELNEISDKYRSAINNNAERFEFITKVMSSYNEHYDSNPKNRIKSFTEAKWNDFSSDFEIEGISPEIVEAVIKLTLHKVLQNRFMVSRIKKEVNL